jgi:hypothetical protein
MILRRLIFLCFGFALIILTAPVLQAQEEDEDYYEKLLVKEVEVENPVYKPVISVGAGIIHFLGDIKNPGNNPLVGDPGYKINISTFIGKNNYYRLNFFLMYGGTQGHDFNISRAMQIDPTNLSLDGNLDPIYHNSSFKTEFFEFGISAEYGFGHLLGKLKRFKPFISVGVSPIQFSPKGNITNGPGSYYHFWDDGTIRNLPDTDPNAWQANIINFDKDWETDLSGADYHDLGDLSQTTVVFPLEAGFDFYLSYRVNMRISTSVHYALTDFIDNYNPDVAKRYGLTAKGRNDMFMFTSFSLNFDLFSDPEMIRIDMLFAEMDYDESFYEVMFADQDGDGVFDRFDDCADTPSGVVVDSLGCPFETDGDGIPDFMDDEPNTPKGSVVDDSGVQLSSDVLAQMFEKPTAVRREEAKVIPVAPIWTRSITFAPGVIPEKFRGVDGDGDGYVSFQELLKAIETFFDGTLNLSIEEIYELNNFFFSQ